MVKAANVGDLRYSLLISGNTEGMDQQQALFSQTYGDLKLRFEDHGLMGRLALMLPPDGRAAAAVFTAAVNAANPELAAARERGIPLLERAKPVFTTLPGWKTDIRGVTDYNALPANARAYVDFLEKEIETPIRIVSTGPKRHEIAMRL